MCVHVHGCTRVFAYACVSSRATCCHDETALATRRHRSGFHRFCHCRQSLSRLGASCQARDKIIAIGGWAAAFQACPGDRLSDWWQFGKGTYLHCHVILSATEEISIGQSKRHDATTSSGEKMYTLKDSHLSKICVGAGALEGTCRLRVHVAGSSLSLVLVLVLCLVPSLMKDLMTTILESYRYM